MVLKFSASYKQCRPCTGSSTYKKGQRPYPDFDTISEGVSYPYIGGASSASTPAWDFTSSYLPGGRPDQIFMGGLNGDRTSRGPESTPACDVVVEEEDETKDWMAQVEPGVHITFVSLLMREMISKEVASGMLRNHSQALIVNCFTNVRYMNLYSEH